MILNLTQHKATNEQQLAGVIDLPLQEQRNLQELLTFDVLPSWEEVAARAEAIAFLAARNLEPEDRADEDGKLPPGDKGGSAFSAMVGGAPWLMEPLVKELAQRGIEPLFAFSMRESTEKMVDGVVTKVATFRHVGFVSASAPRDQA